MKRKIIIFIVLIALVIISILQLELLPFRQEISDVEIVMVAGMDKTDNGYEVTFFRSNESKDNSSGVESTTKEEQATITVTSDTYNFDMRYMQTVTDKYVIPSHIKYFLVGEETAKEDLYHVIDVITRGGQTRLNSKIYVVKSMSAKKFLNTMAEKKVKLEDRLKVVEEGYWSQKASASTEVLDVIKILSSENEVGAVPTIGFNEEKGSLTQKIEENNGKGDTREKSSPFDFLGLAIIKDMNVVDYLDEKQTVVANCFFADETLTDATIKEGNNIISFGIENLKADLRFTFNNQDILNKITIRLKCIANYEEIKAKSPVFTVKKIDEYTKILEKQISSELINIINDSIIMDVDFLQIGNKMEQKHPYKYLKNKKDVWQHIKNSKIDVKVDVNIQTTYGIVESNWMQKGNTK